MAQATKLKPPRPFTRGQVSALCRVIRGLNTSDSLDGADAYDAVEIHNIESLIARAARAVNADIGGVSS